MGVMNSKFIEDEEEREKIEEELQNNMSWDVVYMNCYDINEEPSANVDYDEEKFKECKDRQDEIKFIQDLINDLRAGGSEFPSELLPR